LLGLVGLLTAGCAERAAVTSAEAVAMLQIGRPLLSCREPCLSEWRRVEPQAEQLAAGGRWADLAAVVLRVGYQDDLTEYYLARAAEGLGYAGAAAGYYRRSIDLSGTALSCANMSRLCGGVALPRSAVARLATIDQELERRYRRGGRPVRRPGAGPTDATQPNPGAVNPAAPPAEALPAAPAEPAVPTPSPVAAPGPLITPSPPPPAPNPVPPPRPAAPTASDYIEPPPVMR
jgi:hypothetical protein